MTLFDRQAPNINILSTKRISSVMLAEIQSYYDLDKFDATFPHDIFHLNKGNHLYLNTLDKSPLQTHNVVCRGQCIKTASCLGHWRGQSDGHSSSVFSLAEHIGQTITWQPNKQSKPIQMRTFYNAMSGVQYFFVGNQ